MDRDTTPIYEIRVYSQPWTINDLGWLDFGSEERVGFYYEKESAVRAVEENWCDIQDHYARAALVIEMIPGLYPHPPKSKCKYYIWNQQKEQFESAPIPEINYWPD